MGDGLTLEKLKIDERLRAVEAHMAESKPFRENILSAISRLESSVKSIDDKTAPIESLRLAEERRIKNQETFNKTIIGTVTLALGTFVLWVIKSLIFVFKHQ